MLLGRLKSPFLSSTLLFGHLERRWATNLGGGSTANGRDSPGKRLGVKLGNGAKIKVGQIIIRQRGFQYHPGDNIGVGRDHTLWAKRDGVVKFEKDHWAKRTIVSVSASESAPLEAIRPAAKSFPAPANKAN